MKTIIIVLSLLTVALQTVPVDPGTLSTVSKYLPTATIIALAVFGFYLVKFILNIITVQANTIASISEAMEKNTGAIEKQTDVIDKLNKHVIEEFNKLTKN